MSIKKKIKKKRKYISEIKIDQILLRSRHLFLFGVIDEKLSTKIIKELVVLDKIKFAPILLFINSPGGGIAEGFAIIDAMKAIRSPVITYVTGKACSMAGVVSVAGRVRFMSKNSVWMFHDLSAGVIDYATKIIYRAEHYKRYQKQVFDFMKNHTKLSEKELTQAKNGELWLYPNDCLKKGIIDEVITDERPKKNKKNNKTRRKNLAKES